MKRRNLRGDALRARLAQAIVAKWDRFYADHPFYKTGSPRFQIACSRAYHNHLFRKVK